MTKLEEKLIELGYLRMVNTKTYSKYAKGFNGIPILIKYRKETNDITWEIKDTFNSISYQFQIDNLQQAFNQLKKDLEELKNVN